MKKVERAENQNQGKIYVYMIARISQDAHDWNRKVSSKLKHPIEVFLPQMHNPRAMRPELYSKRVYDVDLDAIKKSHLGLLLPEFGKDCAFEVGWYTNSEKPVIAFVDSQLEWLKDWMVKGGIDFVVTINPSTYDALKKDPILRYKKVILVSKFGDLNDVIRTICDEAYAVKNTEKPSAKP